MACSEYFSKYAVIHDFLNFRQIIIVKISLDLHFSIIMI